MFATALIVFRESLEAALFIGIAAAATRSLPGRGRWLAAGVAAGAAGALLLAAVAGRLDEWTGGVGSDVLSVAMLASALAMLLWHALGADGHGREMAQQVRDVAGAWRDGQSAAPRALFGAVALAVLREGAETVLFVHGAAGAEPAAAVAGGVALGLAGGGGLGALLYAGLQRIPLRRVFTVINGLIALLAASIASQLARALAQAGWVEIGAQSPWDSSGLLPADAPLAVLLHAMAGYEPRPTVLQLACYAGVLALLWLWPRRGTARGGGRGAMPARAAG